MWKGFEAALLDDETISWQGICGALLPGAKLMRLFFGGFALALAMRFLR